MNAAIRILDAHVAACRQRAESDRAIQRAQTNAITNDGTSEAALTEAIEARAAVAELIEADKEFDAAHVALREAGPLDALSRVAAYDRQRASVIRRAAALARVQP